MFTIEATSRGATSRHSTFTTHSRGDMTTDRDVRALERKQDALELCSFLMLIAIAIFLYAAADAKRQPNFVGESDARAVLEAIREVERVAP